MFRGEDSSGAVSARLRTGRLIDVQPGWGQVGESRSQATAQREAVVGVVYFSRTGPKISARGAG